MFTESFKQAWHLRYGYEPEFDFPELGRFLGHRSVRKYADQPLTDELMSALVAAAQSAATSSNLQLWSVVTLQDKDRLATAAELCGNQEQVKSCGAFFCFIADHRRIKTAAETHGESVEGLEFAEFGIMAIIDAALAAERLVCAAEALGLGICYIGGLRNDPEAIKEFLNLPDGTLGCFGVTVGWPAEPMTAEIKPRLSQQSIWFKETYNSEPTFSEYDERMRAFYEGQKMKGEVTWSMRSARRLGLKHLGGRRILREWLQNQGLFRQ